MVVTAKDIAQELVKIGFVRITDSDTSLLAFSQEPRLFVSLHMLTSAITFNRELMATLMYQSKDNASDPYEVEYTATLSSESDMIEFLKRVRSNHIVLRYLRQRKIMRLTSK